jgi:hypothetical protein
MDPAEAYEPGFRRQIADTAIGTIAWCFYSVPFLVLLIMDLGYRSLFGLVAALPAIAYAIRCLFKNDDVFEGEGSYARQAMSYRLGDATRGTFADPGRGR